MQKNVVEIFPTFALVRFRKAQLETEDLRHDGLDVSVSCASPMRHGLLLKIVTVKACPASFIVCGRGVISVPPATSCTHLPPHPYMDSSQHCSNMIASRSLAIFCRIHWCPSGPSPLSNRGHRTSLLRFGQFQGCLRKPHTGPCPRKLWTQAATSPSAPEVVRKYRYHPIF